MGCCGGMWRGKDEVRECDQLSQPQVEPLKPERIERIRGRSSAAIE
jgi:hypothetical protein